MLSHERRAPVMVLQSRPSCQQMSNKFGRMPHAGRQYIASHPYAPPAPLRRQDPRVHGPPPASQTPLMAAPSAHDAADGTLHRWSECRASTNLLDVPCRSHSTHILGMYAAPPHGRTCTAELQAASMYLRERDDREGVSSEVVCSVRVGELRGGMQSCHELGQWTRTSIRPHYRTWYCSSCIIWSEAGGSASTLGVCQLHSTREPYCAGCLELSLMSPLPVESAHSTCHFGGCSASSPREIRSVGRDIIFVAGAGDTRCVHLSVVKRIQFPQSRETADDIRSPQSWVSDGAPAWAAARCLRPPLDPKFACG